MRIFSRARWFLVTAVAAILLMSCAVMSCAINDRSGRSPEAARVKAVATARPDPGAMHRAPPSELVQRLPEVESVGDCAPRHAYASDSRTSCVEGRPCRGFGVRDESGRVFCTCYGKVGGCAEGQRCDLRKLSCVPENELPGGRSAEH